MFSLCYCCFWDGYRLECFLYWSPVFAYHLGFGFCCLCRRLPVFCRHVFHSNYSSLASGTFRPTDSNGYTQFKRAFSLLGFSFDLKRPRKSSPAHILAGMRLLSAFFRIPDLLFVFSIVISARIGFVVFAFGLDF